MKARRNARTKLTEALVAAYREKVKVEVDGQWQMGVMSHIRRGSRLGLRIPQGRLDLGPGAEAAARRRRSRGLVRP